MLTGYLITLGNDCCSFLGVTIVCDYVFFLKSHFELYTQIFRWKVMSEICFKTI